MSTIVTSALPQEVLGEISKYIHARCDQFSFMLVSKSWYRVFLCALYRHVEIGGFSRTAQIRQALRDAPEALPRSITIFKSIIYWERTWESVKAICGRARAWSVYDRNPIVNREILLMADQQATTSLVMSMAPWVNWSELFPNLATLSIGNFLTANNPESPSLTLPKRLTSLVISAPCPYPIVYPPSLTTLHVNEFPWDNWSELLPNLVDLSIVKLTTPAVPLYPLTFGNRLTRLYIQQASTISQHVILPPSLTHLQLGSESGDLALDDEDLSKITVASGVVGLTHLSVSVESIRSCMDFLDRVGGKVEMLSIASFESPGPGSTAMIDWVDRYEKRMPVLRDLQITGAGVTSLMWVGFLGRTMKSVRTVALPDSDMVGGPMIHKLFRREHGGIQRFTCRTSDWRAMVDQEAFTIVGWELEDEFAIDECVGVDLSKFGPRN